MFPFAWSIYIASVTFFGSLTPYLFVFLQYFVFKLDIIMFLFFRAYGTHNANDGSSYIWFATTYLASPIRLASFTSLLYTHVVDSYFHSIRTSYPLVVFLCVLECFLVNPFSFVTTIPYFWWSVISLTTKVRCLLWLVPAQEGHFFYTRSHLSALQNCALIFSIYFQFILI